MLTGQELDKLFDLLEHLHSDKRPKRDEKTRIVWQETLRDWSYEQIREAVFRRAKTGNRFFPDAPEIAAYCPPVPDEEPRPSVPAGWAKQAELLRRHAELQQRRREAGVPSDWREARANGLTAAEYAAACDAAGLGVEVIL